MYTKFYGLTRTPFEMTPDPDFLFLSMKHKEILASLIYGVQAGKGFILVVGDIGTGKTTLINTLLEKLDDRYLVLHLTNPQSNYAKIIEHLAKKMGFNYVNKNNIELAEYVKRGLIKFHRAGKRLVLIIDEAHLLSKDSLEDIRLLSNMATAEHHLIQIVLAGQIELYHKLRSESLKALRQRIVINRTLDPLDREEALEYISHRLRIAGRQSSIFTRSALRLIWQTSQGIPRVINHICDNSLLIGFAVQTRSIGKKIVREVIEDMERRPKRSKLGTILTPMKWIGAGALILISITYITTHFNLIDPLLGEKQIKKQTSISKTKSSLEQKNIAHLMSKLKNSSDINEKKIKNLDENNVTDNVAVRPGRSVEEINSEKENSSQSRMIKLENTISSDRSNPNDILQNVRPKDYLLKLAKQEYGIANDTTIDFIQMANPSVKNVNKIYPGQKIRLPDIERRQLIVTDDRGKYYIHYASFYTYKQANDTTQRLFGNQKSAFLIPCSQGDNVVFRVYLGMFDREEDAENTLKNLKLEFLPFLDHGIIEREGNRFKS